MNDLLRRNITINGDNIYDEFKKPIINIIDYEKYLNNQQNLCDTCVDFINMAHKSQKKVRTYHNLRILEWFGINNFLLNLENFFKKHIYLNSNKNQYIPPYNINWYNEYLKIIDIYNNDDAKKTNTMWFEFPFNCDYDEYQKTNAELMNYVFDNYDKKKLKIGCLTVFLLNSKHDKEDKYFWTYDLFYDNKNLGKNNTKGLDCFYENAKLK